MTVHRCYVSFRPPPSGFVACLCLRGEDHDEDLFDIPVGEEPDDG